MGTHCGAAAAAAAREKERTEQDLLRAAVSLQSIFNESLAVCCKPVQKLTVVLRTWNSCSLKT